MKTETDNTTIAEGDWFTVKGVVRNPQDGSYRGDLFHALAIDGEFVVVNHYDSHGLAYRTQLVFLPEYKIQKLALKTVQILRPEIAGPAEEGAS